MNLQDEIDYQTNKWLIKENEGLNEKEKADLDTWLKDDKNKKAYTENKEIINECLDLDDTFIQEMENEILATKSANNIFYNNKFIAACVVTISIIIFSVFEMYSSLKPIFSQNYISKNHKILNITLPDNTIIDLDAKSEIQVSYYKDKRVVEFTNGMAFFNIAKDKTKPFSIKVGKTLITVLGTQFEVVNLGKNTTINVKEGLVKVDYLYGDKSKTIQFLNGLETLALSNLGEIIKYEKIDLDNIATWKKDIIEFNKTTLKEAFDLFTRYTNQKVEFETQELSLLKVSGKFSTLHYDSFLESVELIYPIKILQHEDTIQIIKSNG